jgi:hypothetical protein
MIKPLIIFFNTVSVFLFSFFFGDTPVTLSGNFPKNAKVATEFIAEIKVNKSSIAGFAKLQLEVPQGFTVTSLLQLILLKSFGQRCLATQNLR